jgi:hypothetical protein
LAIFLKLVLAGLRLDLKNRQVGEKWVFDGYSYLECSVQTSSCLKKPLSETIVINETKSANCVKDERRLSRLSDILNRTAKNLRYFTKNKPSCCQNKKIVAITSHFFKCQAQAAINTLISSPTFGVVFKGRLINTAAALGIILTYVN